MAEKRLIDANALSADFVQNHTANADIYLTVRKILNDAPTVDAVEVVRCKDCVFYGGEECGNWNIDMNDGAHLYTMPDDFCSYGERKMNDA